MERDYAWYKKSADFIRARIPCPPEIGIILGSGLGSFAGRIRDPVEIPYRDIPNFPLSTAPDHAGRLIVGTAAGKKTACMSGRFHSYEGYDFATLATPVRVLKLLGVRTLILTNAAGAVNTGYRPGDVMLIRDHLKLTGASPLCGPNVGEFGPRFFDTSRMYDPGLLAAARRAADGCGLTVHEGVYMFFTGPQFETPAEIRAARALGADAVGMSTVTEALTAAHCGLPALGISLITNMAAGILDQPLSGEEAGAAARSAERPFGDYLQRILTAL